MSNQQEIEHFQSMGFELVEILQAYEFLKGSKYNETAMIEKLIELR